MEHLSFEAGDQDRGERLDRFLARHLPDLSRSRLKELIKAGQVTLAGGTIDEPNHRVKPGEAFTLVLPPPEPATLRAEKMPLDVVYEDDALIVVDKPAGLVVHPAAGNWTGTLVNALLAHCGDSLSGIGGVRRPGIVHRLDKDTSGLMVVAKTDAAHKGLSEQFADHGRTGALERRYKALVWGVPHPRMHTIHTLIGRHRVHRLRHAVLREDGKEAITHYRVCELYAADADSTEPVASMVECQLETGRTHQIRVHMAHISHPLVGDQTYGKGYQTKTAILPPVARSAIIELGRQALHAATLGFCHPITGEHMHFESEPPEDMSRVVRNFFKLK